MQSLSSEIDHAREDIHTDGYDMSIGEIINLYTNKEIVIDPNFQRLFVWGGLQKSRFIESILLNIPLPPIFVYQKPDGVWELVDGLQRLSTIFEFVGILRDPDGGTYSPSSLKGTKLLPSLRDKVWGNTGSSSNNALSPEHKLAIKRSRMRVEILKSRSSENSKFELFQRLNTGGTQLEPQEVRNATLIMMNKEFSTWIHDLAENEDFKASTDLSKKQRNRQYNIELVLRFFLHLHFPYESGMDVHEYIDQGMMEIAQDESFHIPTQQDVFEDTFGFINNSLGSNAFKRWNGTSFVQRFLISAFEAVTYGISSNIDEYRNLKQGRRSNIIDEKVRGLWDDPEYSSNSGAGVRGTTRLKNLLPFAKNYFQIHTS